MRGILPGTGLRLCIPAHSFLKTLPFPRAGEDVEPGSARRRCGARPFLLPPSLYEGRHFRRGARRFKLELGGSEVIYRALPEVGIPFVTPEELKSQIALNPFGRKLEDLPSEAVVVLNQSGQPVLAMSFLWKWADDLGGITQHRMAGLNSLSQLEFEPADP